MNIQFTYKKSFICLITLLLFLLSLPCFSQENIGGKTQQDLGAWLGVDTEYEVFDNFSLSLANQIRFDNNLADFKSYFFELGGDYKLDDYINKIRKQKDLVKMQHSLRVGGSYRYVFRDIYSQNSQRVSAVATYKPFVAPIDGILDVSFRVKYQHDFTWNRQDSRTLLRGKINIKYPLTWKVNKPNSDKRKKLDIDLFTSTEYFYQFHYEGNVPYRLRFQVGTSFELPNFLMETENNRSVTLKYVTQHSLSSSTPERDHIIALLYSFSF